MQTSLHTIVWMLHSVHKLIAHWILAQTLAVMSWNSPVSCGQFSVGLSAVSITLTFVSLYSPLQLHPDRGHQYWFLLVSRAA